MSCTTRRGNKRAEYDELAWPENSAKRFVGLGNAQAPAGSNRFFQ